MSALRVLGFDESEKLVKQLAQPIPNKPPGRRDYRNHLIALLMLDAGLRCGEVNNLIITDLAFEGQPVHSLTIRKEITKTKHERTIPLTERINLAICRMIPLWRDRTRNVLAIFAFTSGPSNKRITRRSIERIIKAAGIISIQQDIHPHILRHTFASRLMRKTNIRIVQQLLGHRSITSTQIYTHPNNVDLSKAIEAIEGNQDGISNASEGNHNGT